MRQITILLLLTLTLSGCIRQTQTDIPSFSGTVVDSNNGQPLTGVSINSQFITADDGQFSFPAVEKKIWNFPIPGAGPLVIRELTFKKTEYRPTTCRVENFALFAKPNTAAIPLVKIIESEGSPRPPVFINLDQKISIYCQAFIGSRVRYNEATYIIGEIYRQEENITLLTLWPVFPNNGDVVLDVPFFDVTLIHGAGK